jgi:hypothetical protein
LINARRVGEKAFATEEHGHSKTFNRKMTARWRLETHIERAQLDVIKSAQAEELMGFKLFWVNRAAAFTPPGRLILVQEDDAPARPVGTGLSSARWSKIPGMKSGISG